MESTTASPIPAHKQDAVDRALNAAFQTTTVDSIDLLAGGLSSALVYKIAVNGRPYVLRIVMQPNAFQDPARQFECMNLAAAAGIAPRVYYTDAADALSITDFIASKPIAGHFSDEELAVRYAQTVKAIHALPLFPELTDYLDGVDMLIANYKSFGLLPESATAELFERYAEIQRVYPRHQPDLVSSHNDLHPNNILFDGERIWVIDWEAAFRSDCYVDLAIRGRLYSDNRALEETYLRAYFGEALDDYKRARYFLMQQTTHVFYGMVFMWLIASARTPETVLDDCMDAPRLAECHRRIGAGEVAIASIDGQLQYAKALLGEALYQMKAPRFAESIALLG